MAYDADEKVVELECPRCFKKFIMSSKEAFDYIVLSGMLPICNECKTDLDNKEPRRGGVPLSLFLATYGELARYGKVK